MGEVTLYTPAKKMRREGRSSRTAEGCFRDNEGSDVIVAATSIVPGLGACAANPPKALSTRETPGPS